jgi:hypothetical protein
MKKYVLAGMIVSWFATGGVWAQDAGKVLPRSECDQWGLSGKDLTDCRMQWSAAKTDAERDRVKAMYVSPAFINSTSPNAVTGRGSSTPPDNLSGPAGSTQPTPTSPLGSGGSSSSAKPGSPPAAPGSASP